MPGMSEKDVEALIGGHTTSTVKMPGCLFVLSQRQDGVMFEVAAQMTADRRVQEVSFKEWRRPTNQMQ
jgi:hypothetical protein